jgi:hypothetical protein
VLGHLSGHRGEAGEEHPEGAHRRAEHDRTLDRNLLAQHRERDERSDEAVRHRGDDQHGGDGRVAAHDGSPDEFGAAILLVGPSVATDQEHPHQRHCDVAEAADLEHHLAAVGVDRVGRAVEGDDSSVAVHWCGAGDELGLGPVEPRHAGGREQHEERDADDPRRQAHSVTAQHEPHQREDSEGGGPPVHRPALLWSASTASSSP